MFMHMHGVNTLQSNEFAVTLDGEVIDSILSCDMFEYLTAAGDADKPFLTFYKQVEDSRDTVFNRWLGQTLGNPEPASRPRRTFVVTAVNDGNPIRRWTFTGAWIAAVAQGSLDSTSHEFAVERISLGYEKITCDLLG
jgi:T4-like virus tail tube protein gp19